MKPIYKLFLITFLATGLTFASLMYGIDYMNEESLSLKKFLIHFLGFGSLMSLFFVAMQKRSLKALNKEETDENLTPKQEKNISTSIGINELLSRIKSDAYFKNSQVTSDDNSISIKTQTSMKSWGEKINITYLNSKEGTHQIKVLSAPTLSTTLVDYGVNIKNIQHIERLLNLKTV